MKSLWNMLNKEFYNRRSGQCISGDQYHCLDADHNGSRDAGL